MVGGNLPNHSRDLKKGIKIRALFSRGNVWYVEKKD
jgi:hypothetical protein